MLHEQLTEQVIGTCFKIQTEIGSRLDPVIYSLAFAIEAQEQNWKVEKDKEVTITYKNQPIGKRIISFLIENKLALNIKSIPTITPAELEEMRYCLKLANLEVGLIINYGNKKVEIRRIELNNNNKKPTNSNPKKTLEKHNQEKIIAKQEEPVAIKKEDDVLSTINFDSDLL